MRKSCSARLSGCTTHAVLLVTSTEKLLSQRLRAAKDVTSACELQRHLHMRVYVHMCSKANREWSSVSADGERTAQISCASPCLYLQHGDKLLRGEKMEVEEVGDKTASARPSAKRGGQWKHCPWSERSPRHCKLADTQ